MEERLRKRMEDEATSAVSNVVDMRYSPTELSKEEILAYHRLIYASSGGKQNEGLRYAFPMQDRRLQDGVVPEGGVFFYGPKSRLTPLMFSRFRTCDYVVYIPLATFAPMDISLTTKYANGLKLINKYMLENTYPRGGSVYGPTFSSIMGASLNEIEENTETYRGMVPPKKDAHPWEPCIANSNNFVELIADKGHTTMAIAAYVSAEVMSSEFTYIASIYTKKYPNMTLDEFLTEFPFYTALKEASLRNALRVAAHFANMLGAPISSKDDGRSFVPMGHLAPRIAVPSSIQCVNCFAKHSVFSLGQYLGYINVLDAPSSTPMPRELYMYNYPGADLPGKSGLPLTNYQDYWVHYSRCSPNLLWSPHVTHKDVVAINELKLGTLKISHFNPKDSGAVAALYKGSVPPEMQRIREPIVSQERVHMSSPTDGIIVIRNVAIPKPAPGYFQGEVVMLNRPAFIAFPSLGWKREATMPKETSPDHQVYGVPPHPAFDISSITNAAKNNKPVQRQQSTVSRILTASALVMKKPEDPEQKTSFIVLHNGEGVHPKTVKGLYVEYEVAAHVLAALGYSRSCIEQRMSPIIQKISSGVQLPMTSAPMGVR